MTLKSRHVFIDLDVISNQRRQVGSKICSERVQLLVRSRHTIFKFGPLSRRMHVLSGVTCSYAVLDTFQAGSELVQLLGRNQHTIFSDRHTIPNGLVHLFFNGFVTCYDVLHASQAGSERVQLSGTSQLTILMFAALHLETLHQCFSVKRQYLHEWSISLRRTRGGANSRSDVSVCGSLRRP